MIVIGILLGMMAGAAAANADGFKCEGVNSGVKVKVYNHTNAGDGTRVPSTMVVSDSNVGAGNQTIATFSNEDGNLKYLGDGVFKAKVDLRYTQSRKKGENIGGTKLGQLKYIRLQIYGFSYPSANMEDGEIADAALTYTKRNGEILEERAICARYLKN